MALGERGKNPLLPRSTAEAACAMRAAGALERDPSVRCPDDMAAGFLGGFNVTTLAKHRTTRGAVLRALNRRLPGGYAYEIARCKFFDEVVLAAAAAGLDELILLGAGLGSRPYRLARQLRGVRVFEVDHPASLESKRSRLRRLLGHEPEHVTFAAVDLNRDDLEAALAEAGHAPSARTHFVCSGVLPYLAPDSATELLSWVGEDLRDVYLERTDGTLHDRPFGFCALIHAQARQRPAAERFSPPCASRHERGRLKRRFLTPCASRVTLAFHPSRSPAGSTCKSALSGL